MPMRARVPNPSTQWVMIRHWLYFPITTATLQLFPPTIRTGYESADRPATRRTGNVFDGIYRSGRHEYPTPSESHCKMVRLNHPILSNTQLDILCNIRYKGFKTVKLPMLFEVSKGKAGLQESLNNLCKMAEESVTDGANYIVLTDRDFRGCNSCRYPFITGSKCRASPSDICRQTCADSIDCRERRNA